MAALGIIVLAYLAPYLLRCRTLKQTGRPVAAWRQWSFAGGIAALIAADLLPTDDRFSVHMAQHLLIADIAALLLVLGVTGPVLAPILRLPGLRWLRVVSHPAVALTGWALNLYLWHLPPLYEGAVDHEWVHGLEHACFLFFSFNFWLALLGPLPKPAWFGNLGRLAYVVLARLIGSVLANVFLWSETIFYDRSYPSLSDQGLAGSIMMIEESVLTIVLFGWLFLRAARQSQEKDELLELAARHNIALDDRRAQRAVAAGHGDLLRRRLLEPGRTALDPAELDLELRREREQQPL